MEAETPARYDGSSGLGAMCERNAWWMLRLSHGTSAEARHGGRLWHYIIGGYWLFTMHPLVFYFPPFVTRRATASRALVLAVTGRGLFRRAFGGHLRKANRHLWSQCYWFFMLWWVQLQVWWVKWSLCYGISPAVCNLCDAYDDCVWSPALVWH